MALKQIVKDALRAAGVEVRRHKLGRLIDPYADQKALLAGRDVRTILDLGANVGQTSLRYRKLFPGATIHAFEPVPEVFRKLQENTRHDPSIRPHPLAAADSAGPKPFFTSTDEQWGGFSRVVDGVSDLLNIGWSIRTESETRVDSTTLDDFCDAEGIDRVQVLKMDIQGGELLALKGAAGLLSARSIDLVYSEVIFTMFYQEQCLFHDLGAHLAGHDYVLFGIYNMSAGKHGALVTGDAIWVSPGLWESLG